MISHKHLRLFYKKQNPHNTCAKKEAFKSLTAVGIDSASTTHWGTLLPEGQSISGQGQSNDEGKFEVLHW
jgi:hypothetical protein